MKPLRLGSNQLHRFYRGGEAIARFRGTPSLDEYAPEDWVGSTTTLFGENSVGLSTLPDGTLLRQAMTADPEALLGPDHVAQYGPDQSLLVKLLDAGERLPVHAHPDAVFAKRHLGQPHGKTEAWLIVEARGRPSVHLGFAEDLDAETLAGWVARQDVARLLAALNKLPVSPGDCIFVPAGLPHSIGQGILLVELQEPSDLSVLLEWNGFAIDGAREGHLGIGFKLALESVTRAGLARQEVGRLKSSMTEALESRPGARPLLPVEAHAYFRAEYLQPAPDVSLEPSFSILIALGGGGRLETEGGSLDLARGETVLVPYAAGAGELTGSVDVIRCLPPLAEH